MRRRQAGFSFAELMLTVTVLGMLGALSAEVVRSLVDARRGGEILVREGQDLKRVVDALERDVRTGGSLVALGWRLEGKTLLRGERVMARDVAEFDYEEAEGRARIGIRLASHRRDPIRVSPALVVVVHRRGGGP